MGVIDKLFPTFKKAGTATLNATGDVLMWDVGAAAKRGFGAVARGSKAAVGAVGDVLAWDVGAATKRGVGAMARGGRAAAGAVGDVLAWDVGAAAKSGMKYVGEAPGKVLGATGRGLKSLAGGTMKNTGKAALVGAAIVGGVYAASSLVGALRGRREYKESERQPDPYMDMPQQDFAMAGQDTLMGMPLVEGQHAQRVKAGRGQMVAGVDATSPGMEQDGRSTVDGRPIQDLGGIGV